MDSDDSFCDHYFGPNATSIDPENVNDQSSDSEDSVFEFRTCQGVVQDVVGSDNGLKSAFNPQELEETESYEYDDPKYQVTCGFPLVVDAKEEDVKKDIKQEDPWQMKAHRLVKISDEKKPLNLSPEEQERENMGKYWSTVLLQQHFLMKQEYKMATKLETLIFELVEKKGQRDAEGKALEVVDTQDAEGKDRKVVLSQSMILDLTGVPKELKVGSSEVHYEKLNLLHRVFRIFWEKLGLLLGPLEFDQLCAVDKHLNGEVRKVSPGREVEVEMVVDKGGFHPNPKDEEPSEKDLELALQRQQDSDFYARERERKRKRKRRRVKGVVGEQVKLEEEDREVYAKAKRETQELVSVQIGDDSEAEPEGTTEKHKEEALNSQASVELVSPPEKPAPEVVMLLDSSDQDASSDSDSDSDENENENQVESARAVPRPPVMKPKSQRKGTPTAQVQQKMKSKSSLVRTVEVETKKLVEQTCLPRAANWAEMYVVEGGTRAVTWQAKKWRGLPEEMQNEFKREFPDLLFLSDDEDSGLESKSQDSSSEDDSNVDSDYDSDAPDASQGDKRERSKSKEADVKESVVTPFLSKDFKDKLNKMEFDPAIGELRRDDKTVFAEVEARIISYKIQFKVHCKAKKEAVDSLRKLFGKTGKKFKFSDGSRVSITARKERQRSTRLKPKAWRRLDPAQQDAALAFTANRPGRFANPLSLSKERKPHIRSVVKTVHDPKKALERARNTAVYKAVFQTGNKRPQKFRRKNSSLM